MPTKYKSETTPNKILSDWLKEQSKSIAQFQREIGYLSGYGYLLLSSTNPRPITYEVIGRLLIVYGLDGPAVAMAEAMRAARANGHSP